MGRYIFEKPLCADYHLPYMIDSLWQKFQVLFLNYNHRQGEDGEYAEILNRIRTGHQTEDDCKTLEQRVKARGDSDLPKEALYIICTNAGVNRINDFRLEDLDGQLHTFNAYVT